MNRSKIFGIIAFDPNGTIGVEGRLPWHYPQELTHFSKTIRGHIIVMGYCTFIFFPKKYFEHSFGIVFSRRKHVKTEKNVIFIHSLDAFLSLDCFVEGKDIYVIGGAQICTLFLKANLIEKLILTELKHIHKGDVFFPLTLIRDWPRQKVEECEDFTTYHYYNPSLLLNYYPT